MSSQLPDKPGFLDWLETTFNLPFRIPRLPFAQTAKNLDKAAGMLVLAGGENAVARIEASIAKTRAMSDAEVAFITLGKDNISTGAPRDIVDRAREYSLGRIARAQANREAVLEIASSELGQHPGPTEATSEIDSDWLDAFARFAEQKSAEDVRNIWGKILAAEIRQPRSVSLRTLNFLSVVTSSDAALIAKAFAFVIDGDLIPDSVRDNPIPYHEFIALQDLGVISGVFGAEGHGFQWKEMAINNGDRCVVDINYFDHRADYFGLTAPLEVNSSGYALTTVGQELFRVSDALSPNYDFFRAFCVKITPWSQIEKLVITNKQSGKTEVLVPPS